MRFPSITRETRGGCADGVGGGSGTIELRPFPIESSMPFRAVELPVLPNTPSPLPSTGGGALDSSTGAISGGTERGAIIRPSGDKLLLFARAFRAASGAGGAGGGDGATSRDTNWNCGRTWV